jgi:uncharacterized repeat protein (TIGR01451 family)
MKNLILVFAFLLAFPLLRLSGQCTTSAGTINTGSITVCLQDTVFINQLVSPTLDNNDVVKYMLFKGTICDSVHTFFGWNSPFFVMNDLDTSSTYGIAVVVGNPSSVVGYIDWGDPCLSISYGNQIRISPYPKLTIDESYPQFDCIHDSIVLTASSNQPNSTFFWTPSTGLTVTNEPNKAILTKDGYGYNCRVFNEFGCSGQQLDLSIIGHYLGRDFQIPYFSIYPTEKGISCAYPQAIFPVEYNSNPDYVFEWSGPNGFISENDTLFAPFIGQYQLKLTDTGNGCIANPTVKVIESYLQSQQFFTTYTCDEIDLIKLDAGTLYLFPFTDLGNGPFSYQWSGPNGALPDTTRIIKNDGVGNYKVTVTNGNGCEFKWNNFNLLSTERFVNFYINRVSCQYNYATVYGSPPKPPYVFHWSSPDIISQTNIPSGVYGLTITDGIGCDVLDTLLDLSWGCAQVKGKIARKTDDLCLSNTSQPLKNWTVQAIGTNTYYATSDENGNYLLDIDTGYYVIKAIPPNAWIWENCSPTLVPIYLPNINQTATANFDFKALQDCPILEVDLTMPALVRCIERTMTLNWCNYGPDTAYSAHIILNLDTAIQITNLQYPYTSIGNGQYQIEIGNVHPNDCKMTNIGIKTSCFTELGQTLCAEAHIYPDTVCHPPINPLWSGANIDLQSDCGSDSLRFTIKNTGFGAINDALEFVVIEDCILRTTGSVPPLASGDSIIIAVPANGATWRVESEQAAYHPYQNQPMLTVEGCTPLGSFSTGFVNHFPFNDADPWLDIQCGEVVGSYDPNDKTGFPLGVGNEHFIAPNTELTYVIRFQNTGTYQAFNIIVKDTLSEHLNPSTIRPTGASHPYRWDLSGEGILTFYFDNINLPDSTANEADSHGWASFRIMPRDSLSLTPPTKIRNQAAIYFDFNAPIFTNTTSHKIGENYLLSAKNTPNLAYNDLKIYPNPSNGEVFFESKSENSVLKIFDLMGILVLEKRLVGKFFLLDKNKLRQGVYFAQTLGENGKSEYGKFIIER